MIKIEILIPFIDHEKTIKNAKDRLLAIRTILTTSGFYKIKIIPISEIASADFKKIIETKINNSSEPYVYELMDIANKVFTESEKIFFYYYVMRGFSSAQLQNYSNKENVIINNGSRIKNSIIKKLKYSLQDVIIYKHF